MKTIEKILERKGERKIPTEEVIRTLIAIKLSIIEDAPDTLFMKNSNSTICDEIDGVLSGFGVRDEDLSEMYDGGTKNENETYTVQQLNLIEAFNQGTINGAQFLSLWLKYE